MKFLTDAQTNFVLVEMLRKLGWDVETVYDHDLETEPNDAKLVAWANQNGFVFVTFDKLVGEPGVLVAGQIRNYGGRLIYIGGGPQQPPERALGKLLFHYETWYPFLEKSQGRVNISDLKQSCKTWSRSEMRHPDMTELLQPQFENYLAERKKAKLQRRRQPKRQLKPRFAKEQSKLNLSNGGA